MVTASTPAAAAVGEQGVDLVRRLAEADHEAGLDERARLRRRRPGADAARRVAQRPAGARAWTPPPPARAPSGRPREQLERALVARLRPHPRVQARDRLEVVVQHVGAGGEHGAQRRVVAAQVRDEHLDGRVPARAARTAAMAAANCAAPPSGRSSRVTLVITTWRRPRRRAASRHAARLVVVAAQTPAAPPCTAPAPRRAHRAEAARPRAHVAEDQERRRAGGEALALVGAARLVADGVQLELVEQGAGGAVLPRRRRLQLEPGRLARRGRAAVAARSPS